jgi:putative Mg2+ transporter-C (MgtC) family protein
VKHVDVTALDFFVRLSVAALLGVAIGFERQWRQRAAGLHTSSLVAAGSAMFALLDTTINGNDTTRIVAGIVTGVGFIAGGAILRSGLNVTGLNTAATMWATAGVGAIAGFGLFPQAAAGAAAIILLNLVLEPLVRVINKSTARRGEKEPEDT